MNMILYLLVLLFYYTQAAGQWVWGQKAMLTGIAMFLLLVWVARELRR